MFSKMKLRNKILSIGIVTILSFSIIMFWLYFKFSREIYKLNNQQIKQLVDTTYYLLKDYSDRVHSGELTLEDAQHSAIKRISTMRFNKYNYFWLMDTNACMLLNPGDAVLNGKSFSEYKDKNGKKMFINIINSCLDKGDTYTTYMWKHPVTKKTQIKLSYARLLKDWNWIIGSGIYIEQIHDELRNLFITIIILTIVISFFLLVSFFYISDATTKPLLKTFSILKNVLQELFKTTKELDEATDLIRIGSKEQINSLKDISQAIERLADEVSDTVTNTMDALQSSTSTYNNAFDCNNQMGIMTSSMNDLKISSKQISQIIKIIDDIAFQTNLLSLNAAIEAARAGEAGKSFTIVANEVRNLAQRTSESANNSTSIINKNIELSDQSLSISEIIANSMNTKIGRAHV